MIIQIWKYGSERLKNVYKFKDLLLGRSGNQTWCQSLYVSHHITMDLQIHYVVSKLSELWYTTDPWRMQALGVPTLQHPWFHTGWFNQPWMVYYCSTYLLKK